MGTLSDKRLDLQRKFDESLVAAVEFELEGSVGHSGGQLKGISVIFGEVDCLLTLRAVLPGGSMVCHIGAATLADCFRKAVNDAYQDKLRWKEDKYRRNED